MPSAMVTESGEMKRLGSVSRVAPATSRNNRRPKRLLAAISCTSAAESSRGRVVIDRNATAIEVGDVERGGQQGWRPTRAHRAHPVERSNLAMLQRCHR